MCFFFLLSSVHYGFWAFGLPFWFQLCYCEEILWELRHLLCRRLPDWMGVHAGNCWGHVVCLFTILCKICTERAHISNSNTDYFIVFDYCFKNGTFLSTVTGRNSESTSSCIAKERRGDGEEKVRLTQTKSALKVFHKREQRTLWNWNTIKHRMASYLRQKKKSVYPQNICLPPSFFCVSKLWVLKASIHFWYIVKCQNFNESGNFKINDDILLQLFWLREKAPTNSHSIKLRLIAKKNYIQEKSFFLIYIHVSAAPAYCKFWAQFLLRL